MTHEELKKYKQPMPEVMSSVPIEFIDEHIEDKYGVYETGYYYYKDKVIYINKENGLWHLMVGANHTVEYYELKEIRYKFMPNGMDVAQIFPPREKFVNIANNCFHLFQITN